MRISVRQYVKLEEELPTRESVKEAWSKIGGICANRRRIKEDPNLTENYYIRGILRNRLYYVDEQMALELLKLAVELGADTSCVKKHALDVRNWTAWRTEIEEFIQGKLEMKRR